MSVSSVAVYGCGPEGLSIVQALASAGLRVVAIPTTSTSAPSTLAARQRLETSLAKSTRARAIQRAARSGAQRVSDTTSIMERVLFTHDTAAVRDVDLVIESTVGDVLTRRALMATLEAHLSRGAILAANAPRDLLESVVEVLKRPEQFLGLRWTRAETRAPSFEVLPLSATAPGVVAACEALSAALRRMPAEEPARLVAGA